MFEVDCTEVSSGFDPNSWPVPIERILVLMQDPKEKIFSPSIEYFSYSLHCSLVGGKKSLAHYRKRCAGGGERCVTY